jgi:hypothetical protein
VQFGAMLGRESQVGQYLVLAASAPAAGRRHGARSGARYRH